MTTTHGSRPRIGQNVTLVIAGRSLPVLARARVLFDRGRGVIVETDTPAGEAWARHASVILSYEAAHQTCTFPLVLAEVISPRRAYLQPVNDPMPMDRREFLRMDVTVQAAMAIGLPMPKVPPPTTPTLVDLSPSGFRWFGPPACAVGDMVRLYLQLPEGFDGLGEHASSPNRTSDLLTLDASVVRIDTGARPGTAAVFTAATTADREMLLSLLLLEGILKQVGS